MTTETTITRAGHRIKFMSKKIDIGNGTENYVLDLVMEDEDGENCHTVHVFTSKPTELYRVTGSSINTLTSVDKLIERDEIVRQVDDEDYFVPTVYGHPGVGKTCINDQTQVDLDEIAHNPNK